MKITCCYQCANRHQGCHASCETYQEQRIKMSPSGQVYDEAGVYLCNRIRKKKRKQDLV